MEAMDICLATVKEISYLIVNHPLYSAIGSFVVFVLLLHFYCRLTLGICDCDVDMTGKTVLITGASSGIGQATALDLARRNARVILACRNVTKAQKVADDIKCATTNQNIIVTSLNLCSFESVKKCAEDVLATEDQLHVLINNAGISDSSKAKTEDGCCQVMQSNHLGHFLLTLLLLDLLKKSAPSRIINLSSMAYTFVRYKNNIENLMDKKKIISSKDYSLSKLANIMFTRELSQRLSGTGVTVNSVHPGVVKTNIFDIYDSLRYILLNMFLFVVGKTSEEGAQTSIYLAVHPDVEKTTGLFFSDCKPAALKDGSTSRSWEKRLYEVSEEVVEAYLSKK